MKRLFTILAAVCLTASAMAMDGNAASTAVIGVLIIILGIAITVGCIYITYQMARNRYRDPVLWLILAFVASPIIAWLGLYIVGEDEIRKKQYEELKRERTN